jgi:hypothetical protein
MTSRTSVSTRSDENAPAATRPAKVRRSSRPRRRECRAVKANGSSAADATISARTAAKTATLPVNAGSRRAAM